MSDEDLKKQQAINWRKLDRLSKVKPSITKKEKKVLELSKNNKLKNEMIRKSKSGYVPIEVLSPMFGKVNRKEIKGYFLKKENEGSDAQHSKYKTVNEYMEKKIDTNYKKEVNSKNIDVFDNADKATYSSNPKLKNIEQKKKTKLFD